MISILGGNGGLERTHFCHISHWEGVTVFKGLLVGQFLISEDMLVLKGLLLMVSSWRGVVVLKEWLFYNSLLDMAVLKGLILDNFHFWQGMVVLKKNP